MTNLFAFQGTKKEIKEQIMNELKLRRGEYYLPLLNKIKLLDEQDLIKYE
jgi:hypothetical protein